MRLIKSMKKILSNSNQSTQMVCEIREGIANNHQVLNKILDSLNYHNELIKESQQLRENHTECAVNPIPAEDDFAKACHQGRDLFFAPKTYNVAHPDYDATVVRNYPGRIFNSMNTVSNPIYSQLKTLMSDDQILDTEWDLVLEEALAELKSIPHSEQIFQRMTFVEGYLLNLQKQYGAFYQPGWVNLNDAIFLYWLVRHLKPKVIVQAGVCNGLSSAFMVLALAKNGGKGHLHAVDLGPVFNANDDAWKVRQEVYGVTIPEGKTSGWLVPDAYADRFTVIQGDAKIELPPLLKKLKSIDMFYHDSEHSYDHMMFEFMEAKKYLSEPGVIVSDDISWNASLWDFADQYRVPAYNYKGSVGIACF